MVAETPQGLTVILGRAKAGDERARGELIENHRADPAGQAAVASRFRQPVLDGFELRPAANRVEVWLSLEVRASAEFDCRGPDG
jgi:hypothetical protein